MKNLLLLHQNTVAAPMATKTVRTLTVNTVSEHGGHILQSQDCEQLCMSHPGGYEKFAASSEHLY